MGKKATKTEDRAAGGTPQPKGKSRLKLAVLALMPVLLAGGGYAGWTFFSAPDAQAEAVAEEAGHPAAAVPSAPPLDLLAENSFTHSLAIAVMIRNECGKVYVPQLLEASNAEAKENGELANLSWMAAARRIGPLTEKTCGHLLAEVETANARAAQAVAAKLAAAEKNAEQPASHH